MQAICLPKVLPQSPARESPVPSYSLNESEIVSQLTSVYNLKCPGARLLRIYWYDGAAINRGPTPEQVRLAHSDNIKVRLGFLNSVGQQKGVDSLIVTDLVELARNGGICEAVLLSGDEDIRIGVQIAQSLGVRVHLIGIAPCRGSQSLHLMQEADTTTEWDATTIAKILTIRDEAVANGGVKAPGDVLASRGNNKKSSTPQSKLNVTTTTSNTPADMAAAIERVASELADSLDDPTVAATAEILASGGSIPRDYDGKLLARSRDALNRDLEEQEKRHARACFRRRIKSKKAGMLGTNS